MLMQARGWPASGLILRAYEAPCGESIKAAQTLRKYYIEQTADLFCTRTIERAHERAIVGLSLIHI